MMKTPRPNLFVIGSMKSGTSYLCELLAAHPDIFMSAEKEPTYFVDPDALRTRWPRMWAQGYWRSEERYLSLFAAAGRATIIGEGSTCYSKLAEYAHVPERILAFNPQARFIYVMRDPVERTISHYWHTVTTSKQRQPLLAAIQANPEYTDVSYYARQLSAYLQHVAPERIYVLTFEELRADPREQMARMYAWLGVDPSFQLPAVPARHVTPAVVDQARPGLAFLNQLRTSPSYINIARYIPPSARKLGAQVAARRVRRAAVSTHEVEAYLRPLQLSQTKELASLLQRSFPEWKTLFAKPSPPGRAWPRVERN